MSNELLNVKLTDIRDNPVALRSVNKESEGYMELVDSVRARGILNAINLRRKTDPDTGVEYFELIDGLHRLSSARDAGLETIPAQILSLEDADVLEAQIIGNVQRIETKPVEYSNQLRRILTANPMMTESELAQKLGKSAQWINQRLGLNKITNEKIADLVDNDKIPLSNAYALAKLPEDEQADFVERAQTETPDVFIGAVNNRIKEIKEARRQGREAAPAEFSPVPHLQKLAAFKEAASSPELAKELLVACPVDTYEDAFILALKWALHLDPISVEKSKADWEAKQAAKEEAKQRRAKERAEKKAAEAAKAAEEAAAAVEDAE